MFRRIYVPASPYRRTGPCSGPLPSTGPTSALRGIQHRQTLQQPSLFPRPPAFLLRNPERWRTRPHITRSGRRVTSADEYMPTLGPGETASMHQPPVLLLDPTGPPGGTDVQPSRRVAQHPPQHPQSPGGAGVGEVGRSIKRRDEVLGLTTAGRSCREFGRSTEVSRQHPAQNALPVGNEREPAEVSCVDLYDKGEGSLLQSQTLRAFGVEDFRHQPETGFHPTRPFARGGSERPAADGVDV